MIEITNILTPRQQSKLASQIMEVAEAGFGKVEIIIEKGETTRIIKSVSEEFYPVLNGSPYK